MNRIHEKDINQPETFDKIWKRGIERKFDGVRMRAFFQDIVKSGDSILDIGAGLRGFVEYLAEFKDRFNLKDLSLYAVDMSSQAKEIIDLKNLGIDYRIGDALNAPFADNMFDVVGAGELIEHLERPEDLVQEMARLCKVGGTMVLSTLDTHCEQYTGHQDYPEHLWEFEPIDLIQLFQVVGETRYKCIGNYHFIFSINNGRMFS